MRHDLDAFATDRRDRALSRLGILEARSIPAAAPRRIVAVGDDQSVLEGLRVATYGVRPRSEVRTVRSAAAALEVVVSEPPDVLITRLRMVGVDGFEVLARVRQLAPAMIRIGVSWYPELLARAREWGLVQRALLEPYSSTDLRRMIERALAVRDLQARVDGGRFGGAALALGPRPSAFLGLGELGAESLPAIMHTLSENGSLASEVVDLANALAGERGRPITTPAHAARWLGAKRLSAVVLFAELLRRAPAPELSGLDVRELARDAVAGSRVAAALGGQSVADGELLAATLLRDIGLIALARSSPEHLRELLERAKRDGRPSWVIAQECDGVSHPQVGAALLASWGLPHAVVDAVAYHHEPVAVGGALDVVALTQIATALVQTRPGTAPIDRDHPTPGLTPESRRPLAIPPVARNRLG